MDVSNENMGVSNENLVVSNITSMGDRGLEDVPSSQPGMGRGWIKHAPPSLPPVNIMESV